MVLCAAASTKLSELAEVITVNNVLKIHETIGSRQMLLTEVSLNFAEWVHLATAGCAAVDSK